MRHPATKAATTWASTRPTDPSCQPPVLKARSLPARFSAIVVARMTMKARRTAMPDQPENWPRAPAAMVSPYISHSGCIPDRTFGRWPGILPGRSSARCQELRAHGMGKVRERRRFKQNRILQPSACTAPAAPARTLATVARAGWPASFQRATKPIASNALPVSAGPRNGREYAFTLNQSRAPER